METKAKAVIDRLTESGYLAFFVGGFVRDRMLGRPVKDIDIATSARPEQIAQLFPHTIPTGLKHGTVTVVVDGDPFEVTTFRTESEYEARRRPKKVEFVLDLESDLARRDFTINAMAMDRDGNLIDPFGGMDDYRRGLLRAVGDPYERFAEDALRIVRCVRFAAEYRLKVDEPTWSALLAQRDGLRFIAMERVRMELERIVEGSHPETGLSLFIRAGLPFYLKRGLGVDKEGWLALAEREHLHLLAALEDGDLRWAHLLLSLRLNAERASSFLRTLTFSNKRLKKITALLQMLASLESDERELTGAGAKKVWKRAAFRAGFTIAECWLNWLPVLADERSRELHRLSPGALDTLSRSGLRWLREMPLREKRELALSGADLLKLRAEPGAWIGHLLDDLAIQVAVGEVVNEKQALIDFAKRQLQQHSGKNERTDDG